MIGSRGEAICYVLLTKPYPGRDVLFRPHFLGDKWQHADFLVEVIGVPGTIPFFFVQVKATREGYTQRETRLQIQAESGSVIGLSSYPAPTYLVGVDESAETGYIVSVNGENLSSMASMNTAYPLEDANRMALWEEVRTFWGTRTYPKLNSIFQDARWR